MKYLVFLFMVIFNIVKAQTNWIGEYVDIQDPAKADASSRAYSLTISEQEIRAYQYHFTLEVSGIQCYDKISGEVSEYPDGKLEFYYGDTMEGGFYEIERIQRNDILFTMKKNAKGEWAVYWNKEYQVSPNGKPFWKKVKPEQKK